MRRSHRYALLSLIILGIVVYHNSLGNGFHFDDHHHIRLNPHIRSLRNIPAFFTEPKTVSAEEPEDGSGGLYRPLLMVTHSLNYAVGGLNPIGYHLVNLGFHVGAAFLLFLIVQAMLDNRIEVRGQKSEVRSQKPEKSYFLPLTSNFYIALAAALLFTVHPFNSEVVNYITARSSVMSAFFYLLAFYFWVKYRSQKSEVRSQKESYFLPLTSYFYMTSLLAFLLALLTKEITITLPVMLVLYDIYFKPPLTLFSLRSMQAMPLSPEGRGRGEGWSKILQRCSGYIPFLLLSLFYLVLRKFMVGAVYVEDLAGYRGILNQIRVLGKYLQLLVWPSPLNLEHDIGEVSALFPLEFILDITPLILVIIVWTGLGLSARYHSMHCRIASFFISWYFVVLLPMIPVTLNAALQENRGYLAGMVFPVVAGIGIGWLRRRRETTSKAISYGLLMPLIIIYSTLTITQNSIWKDEVTLWSDAIEKNPRSVRAYSNLGRAYLETGQFDLAEKNLLYALNMDNDFRWIDYIHIRYDLGLLYLKQKRYDLAREHIGEAIRYAPDEPGFYVVLGNIYGAEKKWIEAEEMYRKSLEIRPGYTEALARLGIIYVIQERYGEAIPFLVRASRDEAYPRREEIKETLLKAIERAKKHP